MSDASALPSFRKPPVGEVLLALQFQQLEQLDLRHVGALVQRFGQKYPHFQAQPPLNPSIERFDGPRPARGVSIEVMEVPLFPRLWLVDDKGEELVQIQRDRLMHNWRHTSIGSEYPRYPRLRTEFAEDWDVLSSFLQGAKLGALLPTQCEVSYINHIDASSIKDGARVDPSTIFSFFALPLWGHGQADFEAVTYSSSGAAREETSRGAIVGRLFVEVASGLNVVTKRPTYQFSLTLRGAPADQGLDDVLRFFDFAHERIVRAFAELTTSEMHKKWERV